MDLFSSTKEIINLDNERADFYADFYSPEEANKILKELISSTPWKQEYINIMGKVSPIPRLTYWYSRDSKPYKYSGIKVQPIPYTKLITDIAKKIEDKTNLNFNSVLLNYYRDGNDSVSWHADDEKSLGSQVNIASISIGAERDFQFKRKDGNGERQKITLTNGSLLVMHSPIQEFWLHQIPKRKKINEPRVNLTFRYIP
tara:strand:+ start:913 stop:1512 length:600 start_codon:yes stop_codon:yes gene_type:complete